MHESSVGMAKRILNRGTLTSENQRYSLVGGLEIFVKLLLYVFLIEIGAVGKGGGGLKFPPSHPRFCCPCRDI